MSTVESELRIKPNEKVFRTSYFLAVGLLATLTMDLAAMMLLMSGLIRLGPYRIVPNLLGRWVGSFPNGTVFHSTILNAPQIRHEGVLGLCCHYFIGMTLASLFLFPQVRIWERAITIRNALVYGVATCIFPYFIMFPAMGFGVMGMKLKAASMLMAFSLVNHAAFGVGIFIWSNLLSKPLLKMDGSWTPGW